MIVMRFFFFPSEEIKTSLNQLVSAGGSFNPLEGESGS